MTHPDLDKLLNALLEYAEPLTSRHGEFYPFGATLTLTNEVLYAGAHTGDEHPESQALIDMLFDVFRQKAMSKEIRAAGICFDVRTMLPGTTEKTDALCLSLEHVSGDAVNVYMPYTRSQSGELQYGEIFATLRKPEFFVESHM